MDWKIRFKFILGILFLVVFGLGCGKDQPTDDLGPSIYEVGGTTLPACYDINHHKVDVRTTRSTEGGPAFSTLSRLGLPIIAFNQKFMQAIAHSAAMALFVYEHECGHHALGHIQAGQSSPHDLSKKDHFQQELNADCYAAQQLREMGFTASSILDVIDDVYPWPKDPEHPSGKVRSRHVAACFKAAGE